MEGGSARGSHERVRWARVVFPCSHSRPPSSSTSSSSGSPPSLVSRPFGSSSSSAFPPFLPPPLPFTALALILATEPVKGGSEGEGSEGRERGVRGGG